MTSAEAALTIAALMVEVDPAAVPVNGQSIYSRIQRMKRLQCLWMARRQSIQTAALAAVWHMHPEHIRTELSYISADLTNSHTLNTFYNLYTRRLDGLPIVPAYVYLRQKSLVDFCSLIRPTCQLHVAAQHIILNQEPSL